MNTFSAGPGVRACVSVCMRVGEESRACPSHMGRARCGPSTLGTLGRQNRPHLCVSYSQYTHTHTHLHELHCVSPLLMSSVMAAKQYKQYLYYFFLSYHQLSCQNVGITMRRKLVGDTNKTHSHSHQNRTMVGRPRRTAHKPSTTYIIVYSTANNSGCTGFSIGI